VQDRGNTNKQKRRAKQKGRAIRTAFRYLVIAR